MSSTRHLPIALLPLLILGCPGPTPIEKDSAEPWFAPGCGDGLLEAGELCDEGEANSDSTPDACREDCTLPTCGDGVLDQDESCDDGDAWGGDGCDPACGTELGQLERESNNTWETAEPWEGEQLHGSLPKGDIDCFSLDLPACGALSASLVGDCAVPAELTLHAPDGAALAVGTPDETGCARLDPVLMPGARFTEPGTWALCVSAMLGREIPSYTLFIEPIAPEDASFPLDESEDPDQDGKPDQCDADRDGDGVDNEEDNCPEIPNGPKATPIRPSDDGFLRVWLTAGPYAGEKTVECACSETSLVAENDADALPELGAPAGELLWTVLWSWDDRINFLERYATIDPWREIYTALYLYSETERTLTLASGPDDGARVWLNGLEVQETTACQGTVIDAYQSEVTLLAGWNRLMIKVRDWGGDWANYTRFLYEGSPVTDLEISLDPSGSWSPDQRDSDKDGQGDVCDNTPTG